MKKLIPLGLFCCTLLLSACGGDIYAEDKKDNDDDDNNPTYSSLNTSTNYSNDLNGVIENAALPVQARLLAAQCAQCHGTFGVSVTGIDSIQNEADELLEEMIEYRGKLTHIMYPHAMAYTDQEINWMSQYFLSLTGNLITSGDRDDD